MTAPECQNSINRSSLLSFSSFSSLFILPLLYLLHNESMTTVRPRGSQPPSWEENWKQPKRLSAGLLGEVTVRPHLPSPNRFSELATELTDGVKTPDWRRRMFDLHLRNLWWMYCPGHTEVRENDWSRSMAGKATITNCLSRKIWTVEELETQYYLLASSQGHHTRNGSPEGERRRHHTRNGSPEGERRRHHTWNRSLDGQRRRHHTWNGWPERERHRHHTWNGWPEGERHRHHTWNGSPEGSPEWKLLRDRPDGADMGFPECVSGSLNWTEVNFFFTCDLTTFVSPWYDSGAWRGVNSMNQSVSQLVSQSVSSSSASFALSGNGTFCINSL